VAGLFSARLHIGRWQWPDRRSDPVAQTIVTSGSDAIIEQINKQLNKVDVLR